MDYKFDISIIIVNYNGKKYIDALFDSLEKLDTGGLKVEAVFLDNASSDDSVEYLRNRSFNGNITINIVENGVNSGFAGGNNAGVAAAGGKYIVLLNNDTAVDKNWLLPLHQMLKENKDCGMVNSRLLFFYDFIRLRFTTTDKIILEKQVDINGTEYTIDNKFCKNLLYEADRLVCFGHSEICLPLLSGLNANCDYSIILDTREVAPESAVIFGDNNTPLPAYGSTVLEFKADDIKKNSFSLVQNAGSGINENYDGFDRGFCEENSEKFDEVCELTNGCGASIMMRRDEFEKIGGFDERFFMYYEDTDLSLRFRRHKKKILYCPSSVVRHIHTGSSKEWSPFFTYHVYRNKLLLIGKNISKKTFIKYFLKQMKAAFKERNRFKMRGSLDALRMLVSKKKKLAYRW